MLNRIYRRKRQRKSGREHGQDRVRLETRLREEARRYDQDLLELARK